MLTDTSDPSTSLVWFITGSSRGLGRALAEKVLASGHRVAATTRNPVDLSELAAKFPDHCIALPCDVAVPAQIARAVTETVAAFGRLDVVVNNAGYALTGAFEELDEAQIARNFETNFFGALAVVRHALPVFRRQGSGHIVNISAAAAISNYPGFSIYGATKWALEGVSESLAAELKPLGIKVTIVQPGPFRTGFTAHSMEKGSQSHPEYEGTSGKFAKLLEGMNGRQPGDPAKAAEAILTAVLAPVPPLRLVLGRYAHEKAKRRLAAMQRELELWEPLGLPTEFGTKS